MSAGMYLVTVPGKPNVRHWEVDKSAALTRARDLALEHPGLSVEGRDSSGEVVFSFTLPPVEPVLPESER